VFVQAPGRLVGDTKLDLSVDPNTFLSQSLHLWQPQAAFGQLQNQAYGYLFPMGPFFALGHALGAPGWVVQRLWQSALLIVAFQGMRVLAGRLGIGTPATRTIGGLAFCLSPWMLAHIGPISIEALPTCVAPWVLVPLVGMEAVERPRRAAALSGLALLCAGGVNATATLALLVLPVILFVTGERGLARRRLAGYWGVAVFLAMAWWLLPLVVLGRYSPPFLTWIESATGTTNTTSIPAALFGTSDWVGHLDTLAGPWWPAGWTLSHEPFAVAGETLVVGLGVVGLIHRSMPYRRLLAVGALVGLALITIGHGGLATSPLAPTARGLLDGALAAFRNIAKFDVVLRIPLVLGFIHCISVLGRQWRRPEVVPIALGGLAVAAIALPVFAGQLEPPGSFAHLPSYWVSAARWLALHDRDGGRALVMPAAQHPEYLWGVSTDEPLQVLASTPWATRDAPVLGGAGEARLLDAVDQVVDSGHGNPGLAAYLARAGVQWVVERDDLRSKWDKGSIPPPAMVHAALAGSPGLSLTMHVGAIEIYRVDTKAPQVVVSPMATTIRVSGAPESLLEMATAGVLTPRTATVMAADPAVRGADPSRELPVVTDGYRRREVNVGTANFNTSATMTPTQPWSQVRAAHDYLIGSATGHQTVALLHGLRSATASTSQSRADATVIIQPAATPVAAFDNDPGTAWESGGSTAVGQWVQANLAGEHDLRAISIASPPFAFAGRPADRVEVTTQAGQTEAAVGAKARTVRIAAGPTDFVRVTILGVAGGGPGTKATLKVRLLGLPPIEGSLRAPDDAVAGAGPPLFVFAAQPGDVAPCRSLATAGCMSPILQTADTADDLNGMDRTFTLHRSTSYTLGLQGVAYGTLAPVDGADGSDLITPCGRGPSLTVDGTTFPTEVADTPQTSAAGQLAILICGGHGQTVELGPGTHRVRLEGTSAVTPDLIVMRPSDTVVHPSAASSTRTIRLVDWQSDQRRLTIGAGPASWLIIRENANAGWGATLNGHQLAPGIVDGWQQAFVVPAGSGGTIEMVYGPDRWFRDGLLLGAIMALALIPLALLPERRRVVVVRRRAGARRAFCAVLGIGAVVVIAGVPGAVVVALLMALALWVGRRMGDPLSLLRKVATLALVATGLVVLIATHSFAPGVTPAATQLLALVAVAALAVGLAVPDERPLRQSTDERSPASTPAWAFTPSDADADAGRARV
jgi:arabinofuranan 3-O-arabinosyltransferase